MTTSASTFAAKDQHQDHGTGEAYWRQFTTARTADAFCQAWLGLLCDKLEGVSAGVVLLESGEEQRTFVPIAVWPKPTSDLSRLGKIAERALVERRGIVQNAADAAPTAVQISYPIQVGDRIAGAVALETFSSEQTSINRALREIHWGIAWLADIFNRRELQLADAKATRIASVMEALATSLRSAKLQQTLFEVANSIARQLKCSRTAIGIVHREAVKVAALSDAAWIEKNTNLVKRYAAVMDEAVDKRAPLGYTRRKDNIAPATSPISTLEELVQETAATDILAVPLMTGVSCVGVLTLERSNAEPFSTEDKAWVDAFVSLLPAVIDQKKRAESGYIARIREDLEKLFARLFGPRHLLWKCSAALLTISFAVLALVEIDYRVSAKTVIEGEIQRVAAAPFEGFLAAAHVRAGDIVRAGQILCELDDRELKIEQAKWAHEREQHEGKLREAMANRDLASIQVISAQVRQAEAQLALANERIKRSKITAPFDGIVVSGDLSQQIGAPLEHGKKLFEIAPLASYRVILQVDEREIRHLEAGQSGKLVIAGIAGDAMAFKVSSVTPVATAQDGRNFFRVEARLQQASARLRPGMEGIGKVETGPRGLWWILTHSFTDWLRLNLWSWLP